MTNIKQCSRCNKDYDKEGQELFRSKMKYPLHDWCIKCLNEFLTKPEDDEEVKQIKKIRNPVLGNIDWHNEKNVIIAILIIVLIFAFFISLRRDYGDSDNYPEERPLDIDYNSIF